MGHIAIHLIYYPVISRYCVKFTSQSHPVQSLLSVCRIKWGFCSVTEEHAEKEWPICGCLCNALIATQIGVIPSHSNRQLVVCVLSQWTRVLNKWTSLLHEATHFCLLYSKAALFLARWISKQWTMKHQASNLGMKEFQAGDFVSHKGKWMVFLKSCCFAMTSKAKKRRQRICQTIWYCSYGK